MEINAYAFWRKEGHLDALVQKGLITEIFIP